MNTPKCLTPLDRKNVRKFGKTLDSGGILSLREDGFEQSQLYIFGAPISICDVKDKGFFINPEGAIRYEWFIRQARKRSNDLWGSFSQQLVMLNLKGGKKGRYEVNCGQADAVAGMGVCYQDSYLMSGIKKQDALAGFYFAAKEMLRLAKITDLPEAEVNKLVRFLTEDYRTGRYTTKSNDIGMEADSVFFPAPAR